MTPDDYKGEIARIEKAAAISFYVEGLGQRNPVIDHAQIAWYWDMLGKKNKALKTRRILDFIQKYEPRLHNIQAYELIAYINANVSQKQRIKRIQGRAVIAARDAVFMSGIMADYKKLKGREAFMQRLKDFAANQSHLDICAN